MKRNNQFFMVSITMSIIMLFLLLPSPAVEASNCHTEEEPVAEEEKLIEVVEGKELPVRLVPGFYSAAEAYFSPDGQSLIMNAQENEGEGDHYHVFTCRLDGSDKRLINGVGDDACSFFFPDGRRLIFTSTKDNLHLPEGNYSKAEEYPTGAELYIADVDGTNV